MPIKDRTKELTRELNAMNILDVANSLGMELKKSGQNYVWAEHDSFLISPSKNIFSWFSKGETGGAINLVKVVKGVNFREAVSYLRTGEFKSVEIEEEIRKPFEYKLGKYEDSGFARGRDYLKNERQLSDETIDFFIEQGVLAESTRLTNVEEVEALTGKYFKDKVLVFKSLNENKEIIGTSLVGLDHPDIYHFPGNPIKRKQIGYNSDGQAGMNVSIGQPKRLVFAESPIDLMSYYELHKNALEDVMLVAMDGLKPATIKRYVLDILSEGRWSQEVERSQLDRSFKAILKHTTAFKNTGNLVTLAIDNDEAGHHFIEKMRKEKIPVIADMPALKEGESKTDWNEVLKLLKGNNMGKETEGQSKTRLEIAEGKLERLQSEFDQAIEDIYAHQNLTNGQPMNDKRNGPAFFAKAEKLDQKASRISKEMEEQKERIEYLKEKEENKANGLNKNGIGLEMSVRNIPRIEEEIKNSKDGEAHYNKATINRYKKELIKLKAQEATLSMAENNLSPGAKQLIEGEELSQWNKKPNIYFLKGLRKVALELKGNGGFEVSQTYFPKTAEDEEKVKKLLDLQKQLNEAKEDNMEEIDKEEQGEMQEETSLFHWRIEGHERDSRIKSYRDQLVTEELIEEIQELDERLSRQTGYFKFYFEKIKAGDVADEIVDSLRIDIGDGLEVNQPYYNSILEDVKSQKQEEKQENTKKAPDQSQKPESIRGGTFNRNPSYLGTESSKEVPKPVVEIPQPTFPTYARLHFSIEENEKSRNFFKNNYHKVNKNELNRLNRYGSVLQNSAEWYRHHLANSNVHYFYKEKEEIKKLAVNFSEESFMHLTGIFPIKEGQTASQTLHDFADGNGAFGNILVSKGFLQKLQVLPLLPEMTESKSFIFDDLSEVEKFGRLNVDKAIQSEDKDLLLAFRTVDGETFPATLLNVKSRGLLAEQLKNDLEDKTILGVFRERDGVIDTLSVNDAYIKDMGKELKELLEKGKFEEIVSTALVQEKEISKEEIVAEGNVEASVVSQNETVEDLSKIIKEKDTKKLSAHLKEGLKNYLNSDTWKNYLEAQSKFHNYSHRNVRLILGQNPQATQVASYRKWQNEFERHVKKGSESLKIWAPIKIKLKDENGKELLDSNGKPRTKESFTLVSVFDVSQTEGKEIPKAIYELDEKMNKEDFVNYYKALKMNSSVQIKTFDEENSQLPKGANGFYNPRENYIGIVKGKGAEMTLKILIHEITHADLHSNSQARFGDEAYSRQEFEAESVAYIVANHLGIDSSDYSFGYISSWIKQGRSFGDLEESLDVIQKQASKMIKNIDQTLEKIYSQEKNKSQSKLDKTIEAAKEKQSSVGEGSEDESPKVHRDRLQSR